MALFKRRSKDPPSLVGYWIGSAADPPAGYHRLIDSPEVAACINRIAAIVSSAPIYLMENTKKGDVRIHDGMSRLVDIDPWPAMGTRSTWMDWIVSTMLGEGDGNAFVLPEIEGGQFSQLLPMPGAAALPAANLDEYYISWRGEKFHPSEVLHFRLFTDPACPWKGRGYQVQLKQVVEALENANAVKKSLSSPDYKPPLCVFVNDEHDYSDEEKREKFRKKYLSDAKDGKPWILPADLVKIEQVRPLTLADLAIKDTIELDKKTVASIMGAPPYMVGIGNYDPKAHNGFIRTEIIHIANVIEQQLTQKLLENPRRYYKLSRRRLYDYDLKTLIDIDCALADRGYLNGDEVREDADRDPIGLTEYKVLENYIPYDMSGNQKKLTGNKEESDA